MGVGAATGDYDSQSNDPAKCNAGATTDCDSQRYANPIVNSGSHQYTHPTPNTNSQRYSPPFANANTY